ncbi:A/G-specific adenine glycosylase [bacterium]|nr:A/G-specific adenine glycosylase [bacterium]
MIDSLRDIILNWYRQNGRMLPWRQTNDPYSIWLSEVILQQTRVAQGLPYYERFTQKYPSVGHLAEASEQEVLRLWQGLGYYSRARNMHATARQVVSQYGGEFPQSYNELIKLKGVGAYTAAAIASFAFNEPKAVLDGNVFRVLARWFNLPHDIAAAANRKQFQDLAQEVMGNAAPAEFNQAIMDFGALQCSPKPLCHTCPASGLCLAFAEKTVAERPVKIKKIKRKTRYFHYLMPLASEGIWLAKRSEKDIWQNMYEPFLLELDTEKLLPHQCKEVAEGKPKLIYKKVHKLTHQDINARFYVVDQLMATQNMVKIKPSELHEYPLPRLVEAFFENEEVARLIDLS